MNKKYIGVIIMFVIIGGAIALGIFFENRVPKNSDSHGSAIPMAGNLSEYTRSEIATHVDADDCWIVVDGTVYDVTEYVSGDSHPGGHNSLISGCGNDETERFNKIHSERAKEELQAFLVGTVAK